MKKIDLTGQKFDKLTVLHKTEKNKYGRAYWLCECECGNLTIVPTCHLKSKHTTSCGCSSPFKFTHGGCANNERLYSIWYAMKRRCYKPNVNNFKDYGGRGIKICDEWLNDYLSFKSWALTNGYQDNLSIDRIDVNGNYEPGNCRWASRKIQANNIRSNHLLTFNGITKTLAEWADVFGINYQTIASRINKFNWPIEKALIIPANERR